MRKQEPAAESPQAYRLQLLARREEVLSGLGTRIDTLAQMGRVAEDDQAQISHDEFISLQVNRLDYGQLRLVDEALDRLSSGEYGVCLVCDEPIAVKRLRALPWARHCVRCEESLGAEQEGMVECLP
jgi:DnaK suppressor protein